MMMGEAAVVQEPQTTRESKRGPKVDYTEAAHADNDNNKTRPAVTARSLVACQNQHYSSITSTIVPTPMILYYAKLLIPGTGYRVLTLLFRKYPSRRGRSKILPTFSESSIIPHSRGIRSFNATQKCCC